jgi:predicted transcriptional regulator
MGRKRVLFESLLAIAAIFLLFSVYLMVSGYAFTTSETRATVKWDAAGNGTIYYLTACDDGTLRALMDGRVSAIGGDGSVLWSVDIPDKWWVGSKYYKPAVDTGPDGTLYVYLRANVTRAAMERKLPYTYAGEYSMDMDDHNKRLMDAYAGTEFSYSLDERVLAISPKGDILWNVPLSTGLYDADIKVRNGTVYVYHGFDEAALSRDGHVLWDIGDVGAVPAVDEAGYVYTVVPIRYGDQNPSRRVLSGIVQAYHPDGAPYWRLDTGEPTYVQPLQDGPGPVPLYDHGTLYLPLSNGVAAMDRNGTIKWARHYNMSTALFELSPFDHDGNVYLRCFDGRTGLNEYAVMGETYYTYPAEYDYYPIADTRLSILSPGGSELASVADPTEYAYADDGIAYRVDVVYPEGDRKLETLESAVLTAKDLKGNRTLWSHVFTPDGPGETVLNASNVKSLFLANEVKNAFTFNGMNARGSNIMPAFVCGDSGFRIIQGKDVTYAGFWTYNYEAPAIYNESRVAYAGGLYAFDRAGRLLWSRTIDSLIGSMCEKNGTIYYSTGSGMMSAAHIDIITGLAIAAALYVLIRFIAVGAISRARGLVNRNDNRNAVLKYIAEHPGSTMYEISRSLGINKGTVRYHLFILSVNHRITSHKADKKFVRFFLNSNSYDKSEQQLMSLMRRDSIRKVMEALLRKPGLSNVELSKELNLPESAMSKHMKELYTRGIVDKSRMDGGVSYRIKDEVRVSIVRALERMGQ